MTTPTVTPWSASEPPSRAALEAVFRRDGLSPSWWSNRRGYNYTVHSHRYHKMLYCAQGSIRFCIQPSGQTFDLSPGDRLDIPSGIPHSAIAGPDGVTCAEAPVFEPSAD